MKQTRLLCIAALMVLFGAVVVSCKGKKAEVKPVKGVLEEPVREGSAPDVVNATLDRHVLDQNFELILNDSVNHVQVWSLMSCDSVTSSEGFGIVVAKDGRATIFADIRHGNTPAARYNAATGELWLTGVSVEGTGVHTERFYRIGFKDDGPHFVAGTIDPYEMQQALCDELKYSVNGENITLYNGEKELATVTNTVKDMGDFYEDAVWVGEQISYDINGDQLFVNATPGVSFVTGKVLHYDDMPTITARVTLNNDGSFTLSDISVVQSSN
jgi:hypothetical protein